MLGFPITRYSYRKCIQEVDVKEKKVHLDLVVEKFRVEEQQ